jgi:hypothetical protein
MSQHDFDVANGTGAAVRADINAAFEAAVSLSSGAAAPSVTFPNMFWYDTTASILKQRNNANTAWSNTAILGPLPIDAVVLDLAARAAHDGAATGFAVLVADADGNGRAAYYRKNSGTSGDWSTAVWFTGPQGTAGPAGEPLVITIANAAGIADGVYPMTRKFHGSATFTHIYAEVLEGTGAVVGYIHKNGVAVYGPISFTAPATFDVTGLGIALAPNDTVDFVLESAAAGVTLLLVQMDGVTTIASATYTEGTWTPGLTFGGSATGITYHADNAGSYTKVGRRVVANFRLKLTNKGAQVGAAKLTGLPVATHATRVAVLNAAFMAALTTVTDGIGGVGDASATTVALYNQNAGASVALTNTNFGNTSEIVGTVTYEV